MKRAVELVVIVIASLFLASCSGSFKDIKVTSCVLTEIVPRGLSAFDATIDLGVDNPAPQVTLSEMKALIKMDQVPCLHLTAEDVTLAPRSESVYTVTFHGVLDENFNPFSLLQLFNQQRQTALTADFGFRGTLRSGLGKYFEYTDIPIKDLLDRK